MPIRLRLTLVFTVGMAIVLAGFGAFVYLRVGRDILTSVDLGLRARVQAIVAQVEQRGSEAVVPGGGLIDPDESFAQILDERGRLLRASSESAGAPLLPADTLRSVQGPSFFERTVPRIDMDPVRLLAVPVEASGHRLILIAGATLGDRKDALWGLFLALVIGGPIALSLISGAGWVIVGGALRPVDRMRQEADAVSASEPGRRLPVPNTGDEVARLGVTLNAMLDRLQEALEREHRFVDDASHELRTPLSVLKMELDLALARGRTPEELEAALRNASEETDRLVRLAEDLLVLARMKRDRLPLDRKEVSMADLMGQALPQYDDRARRAGARIELDLEPGPVPIDPIRVRQALENLLDNALRHGALGGVITIRSERTDAMVRILVEDTGPGFPKEVLERAFEPFVRSPADLDGNGSGRGAGLGLAIVRAVAEAHGGTAIAENLPAGGARVTLLLRT